MQVPAGCNVLGCFPAGDSSVAHLRPLLGYLAADSPQKPPPAPIMVPVCLSLSTKGPDPEGPPTQDTEGQGKIRLGG